MAENASEWLKRVIGMGAVRVDLVEVRGTSSTGRVTYWEGEAFKRDLGELAAQMVEAAKEDGTSRPIPHFHFALFAFAPNSSDPLHRFWIKLAGSDGKAVLEHDPKAEAHASLAQVNVQLLRTNSELVAHALKATQGRDDHWERLLSKVLERVESSEKRLNESQNQREQMMLRQVEREMLAAAQKRAEKNDDFWFEKASTYLPMLVSRFLSNGGKQQTPAALEALFSQVANEITPEEVEAFGAAFDQLDARDQIKMPFMELFMSVLRKQKRRLNAGTPPAPAPDVNGVSADGKPS